MSSSEREDIVLDNVSPTRAGKNTSIKPHSNSSKFCKPIFESKNLFGQSNEINIVHEGEIYRLKITRLGKLILNK